MLCEHCLEKIATVHVTVLSWPSGEQCKHFCESCAASAQAESAQPDVKQPATPVLPDVEHLTATELLQFSARAAGNAADKPILNHIHRELERLPATRDRLALELRMALQSLEFGNDPYDLIGLGGCLGNATHTEKPAEYAELLEKLIVRSFEQLSRSPNPRSSHPFGFGLTLAIVALSQADPQRSATVMANLKNAASDQGRMIIADVEQHIAEAAERQRRNPGSG